MRPPPVCGQVRYFWPCAALEGETGREVSGRGGTSGEETGRVTHTGTYVHGRPRRLQFAQMDRPSHLSLRPGHNRGQHGPRCWRRAGDSPRQNVHAMGVRRGVRGVYWCSPSESSLRELPELLYCTARDFSVAARGSGGGEVWTHHGLHCGRIGEAEVREDAKRGRKRKLVEMKAI